MGTLARHLFAIYRKSPFWLREILAGVLPPLRWVMRPFRRLEMDGYSMFLDFRDNASFKYLADRGAYERSERNIFLTVCAHNPDAAVLDIGANYGSYALAAARLTEFKLVRQVVAFEPDPLCYGALSRSIEANDWGHALRAHQVIVGDQESVQTLYVNARSSADNRTHQVTSAPIRCRRSMELRSTTVDTILQEDGIPFNSTFVIKMDIQGNEVRALHGMRRALKEARGFALFMEVAPYLLRSAGSTTEELLQFLNTLGIDRVFSFGHGSLQRLDGLAEMGKVLVALDMTTANTQGPCDDFLFTRNVILPPGLVSAGSA